MSAIRKSEDEAKLLVSFEKSLFSQGFRVVDLDVRLASKSLVRVYIDRIQGGGVSIADCATVTRLVSPLVDEEIKGKYDLEVSSPGIDRRLREQADFESFVGEPITLRLEAEVEGLGKNVHGVLKAVSTDGIEVVADSRKECKIPFALIRQANLKR